MTSELNASPIPILTGTGLTKSYPLRGREIRVLTDVSFVFPRGSTIAVSGRSGAGKSTLLSLLAGLDRPTSGSIRFEGTALETLSVEELALLRRNRIGIIFQNFNLLPTWTAVENVEAVLMHTGIAPEVRREKAVKLLESLGLGERLDNLPSELSVGQQQRVAVARTLANDPSVILADEPTGDVDHETADEILSSLFRRVKTDGATLIVATHGAFPIERADLVYRLADGILTPGKKA